MVECLFFDVADCVLKLIFGTDELVIETVLPIEGRKFMATAVFSLKALAIEFDIVWQFKFPVLAVRQIETKDEIDVYRTDTLDIVHNF